VIYIRWLLVIPLTITGWFVGLFTGLLILQIGEWTCPQEQIVSGMCTAPWIHFVFSTAVVFGSFIAAAFMVAVPSLIAPSHKYQIARLCFCGGCIFSIYGLYTTNAWLAFVVANVGGFTALYIRRRNLKNSALGS
jgi:hypothetical protein